MSQTTERPCKLSVIVPCYKVEQYLPKCLASLVGQTLQDIEVICINDGSPDRCIDILHEWHDRYPDKIVIIDKRNEGVWRGRWDGIAIAKGEYIGFLDSDDYVEPDFAESLYEAAKASDADIAVCGFARVDLETGKVLSTEMCSPRPPFTVQDDPGRLLELNGAPWNKIFRAEILKNMRDLESPPPVLDDLVFHLLAYLDTKGAITFVPKSLIHYMVRAGSIINTVRLEQVDKVYDTFLVVKGYYEEAGASSELMCALDAITFLHLGISLNYRLSASPDVDIKQMVARCTTFLDENFPTWRKSPYISPSYAHKNGGAQTKLLVVSSFYKAGLLPQFLSVYRFVIEKFSVDIKW